MDGVQQTATQRGENRVNMAGRVMVRQALSFVPAAGGRVTHYAVRQSS